MSLPATTTTHLSPPPPRPTNSTQSLSSDKSPNHHLTFKKTKNNNVIARTTSLHHHCRGGRLPEAAAELTGLRVSGVEPNYITFITLISACARFPTDSLSFGMSLHAYVRKLGLDTTNVKVGSAVVDFYSKCGCVDLARLSFDEIRFKNVVSWNAMINGYVRNGRIEDAVEMFDEMPQRDAVSWTAMVFGFVKKDQFEKGLEWFQEMQLSGVEPDYVTLISVLAACANLGALRLGFWVHRYVLEMGVEGNARVSNSLIDMYARCGCIDFARQVFLAMKTRTLVSWNSMIVGFAINGYAEEALRFFNSMQEEGFEPDGVSFTGALAACSHAGLVDEGLNLFEVMKKVRKILPTIEHYGCIVDLYSRAGRLEEALDVIEKMPMRPNEVVLGSLLAACRTHGDVNLAERLTNYLLLLDPSTDSNYVLLSNMYAAAGSWSRANDVRKKMKDFGIQKTPGISSIEVDCNVHEFVAGDKSHAEIDKIYEMLEHVWLELVTSGYVPESGLIDT